MFSHDTVTPWITNPNERVIKMKPFSENEIHTGQGEKSKNIIPHITHLPNTVYSLLITSHRVVWIFLDFNKIADPLSDDTIE